MKRLAEQSLYEILEVPPGAPAPDIQVAYERARSLYGPDSLALYTLLDPDEATLLARRIEEARSVLLDPQARAGYDAALAGNGATALRPGLAPVPSSSLYLPVAVAPPVPAPPVPDRPAQQGNGASHLSLAEPETSKQAVADATAESPAEPSKPPAETAAAPAPPAPVEPRGETPVTAPVRSPASAPEPVTRTPAPVREVEVGIANAPPEIAPVATPITAAASAVAPPPEPRPRSEPAPRPAQREVTIPDGAAWSGELLRKIREARGLSLQQIAERTKVTRHHLENIEADRYEALPAAVYLRGILMSFAKELRLDGQKVSRCYLELVRVATAEAAVAAKPR